MTMRSRDNLAIKVLFAIGISAAVYFRVHAAIFPFLMPALLACGFVWGEWEERVTLSALVITLEVLTVGPHLHLFPHSFDVTGSRLGVTVVGAIYLVVLLSVAAQSNKWWPSWTAAFQILIVVSHPLFVVLHEQIEPWAYASGIVIWSWLQLIAIGCGIFDCRARRRFSRNVEAEVG